MAWRAIMPQPVGVTDTGQFSVVAHYYDDADPANTGAGLATAKTGTATASTNLISITAHGYSAGDQLVISALTGGAGLLAGDMVTVLATGLTANAFAVTRSPTGSTAIDILTNATSISTRKYTPATNVLWVDAFNMPSSSTEQALIDEATRRGQVGRERTQARDAARATVLVGASIPIP
jgi:hypothetical protein